MTRLAGLGAMTVQFAALAVTPTRLSRAQITQIGQLLFQVLTPSIEFRERYMD